MWNLSQITDILPLKLQYTIEEKVIERAYKKLALDALVIQQGRLAEQKSKHLWKTCIYSLLNPQD